MDKAQAKAWLPLIQAVAEGKTIQLKDIVCVRHVEGSQYATITQWVDSDLPSDNFAACDPSCYRIKPEPKARWFRVALHKSGAIGLLSVGDDEEMWQKKSYFVRWLTDRIEYELPEGEA